MHLLIMHMRACMQTAPSFTYDHSVGKFEGPAQKSIKEQDIAKATEEEDRKQVLLHLPEKSQHTIGYARPFSMLGFLVMQGGKWHVLSAVWGKEGLV